MIDESTLVAAMVAEIRDLLPELAQQPIDGGASLRDLGLNSMDRVDVIMVALALAQAGKHVPMTSFSGAGSIAEIARRILAPGA